MDCVLCPWNSSGKNSGVGSYSLLQGIFPTQGSNLGLLHCRQILHHLSYREVLQNHLTQAQITSSFSQLLLRCLFSLIETSNASNLFVYRFVSSVGLWLRNTGGGRRSSSIRVTSGDHTVALAQIHFTDPSTIGKTWHSIMRMLFLRVIT